MDTSETYKKSIVNPLEPLEVVEVVKWYEDPIYIKMCEKAEEIQKNHKLFKSRDFYAYKRMDIYCPKCANELSHWERGDYCSTCGTKTEDRYYYEIPGRYPQDGDIWLPRQDQLQEMLQTIEWGGDLAQLVNAIHQYTIHSEVSGVIIANPMMIKFKSMEQLWLAFVMKEKHNKVWTGEDWVK